MDTFETYWPKVKPVVKKLIYQEPIHQIEWQHLFSDIHQICTWDEHGPHKLLKYLRHEFKKLLKSEIRLKLIIIEDGIQLLTSYSKEWKTYSQHCERFPIAFQQLDLATRNFILGEPEKNSKAEEKIKRKNGDSTVRTLLLKLWNDLIVSKFNSKLNDSVTQLIAKERLGQIVDRQLVINLRDSYLLLDQLRITNHKTCLMRSFIEAYRQEFNIYYSARAADYLQSTTMLEYVKWASERVKLEIKMGKIFLPANDCSYEVVSDLCCETMIAKFVDQFVRESLIYMESQSAENLKLIFDFVQLHDDCEDLVLEEFGLYLERKFMNELAANNVRSDLLARDLAFIDIIIDTYSGASKLVVEGFSNHSEAITTLDECFQMLMHDIGVLEKVGDNRLVTTQRDSKPESRLPEIMALYCEWCLKNSASATSSSTDMKLLQTLPIIMLFKNPENFIKYHRILLTRRLILNTARDLEKEEEYCQQLRDLRSMPYEELNRIHRMFKDLKASNEFQSQYTSHRKCLENDTTTPMINHNNNNSNNNNNNETQLKLVPQMELNAKIKMESQQEKLSSSAAAAKKNDKLLNGKSINSSDKIKNIRILNPSCWPSSQTDSQSNIKLPESIMSIQENIEQFYRGLYNDKKLLWSKKLSNGVITYTSNKGKYDLHVNALQYTILETLDTNNNGNGITYAQLEAICQIDSTELKRSLWSLVSNPKLQNQLVLCHPNAVDEVNKLHLDENKYYVNRDFMLTKNGLPVAKGRVNVIGRLQIS